MKKLDNEEINLYKEAKMDTQSKFEMKKTSMVGAKSKVIIKGNRNLPKGNELAEIKKIQV